MIILAPRLFYQVNEKSVQNLKLRDLHRVGLGMSS